MHSSSGRWAGRWLGAAGLAIIALGASGRLLAADEGSALENMLVRDSQTTLQLRSYYFDRQKPGPVANEAWALGGWLGYRSGWLGDVFSFGLTGYTSQPLWAPADAGGSLLLTSSQDGYLVLGQAWAALKLFDQTLTGGRFEVIQPEVNPQDNRMTPNTFEGGALTGQLAGLSYFGGWLSAEKTRNATTFVNMATVAGAPAGVESGMGLIGLKLEPTKDLALRLSGYHVPDVLNSTFADAAWTTALSGGYKLRLGAQGMYQASTGSHALTGSPFSTWVGGAKVDLESANATGWLAYNQTGRGAAYRAPYGSWAGYTGMIIQDFDQAGQKALLVGASYDFAGLGAPGLVLNGNVVFGRDAIDTSTAAALPSQTEYDLTLDYRFTDKTWPKWAQPLWIRARAAYLDQSYGGNTTDYRIILNYPFDFK